MEAARRSLVTESEFLALPETVGKVELIDGEVFGAPSPTFRHQWIARKLLVALSMWSDGQPQPFTVGHAPSDVRFGPGRILQPDIYVVRGRVPQHWQGPLDAVPFLCVEVLSQDRSHDRVTKRFVYGKAGVEEYWVVEQSGMVERWAGERLDAVEEVTGTLVSPRLPGFSFDLATLRPPPEP
jgi:Uma2 family endonuclease